MSYSKVDVSFNSDVIRTVLMCIEMCFLLLQGLEAETLLGQTEI